MTKIVQRVRRDLHEIADRAPISSTARDSILARVGEPVERPEGEVVPLSRNEYRTSRSTWGVAAAIAAATVLIVAGIVILRPNRTDDISTVATAEWTLVSTDDAVFGRGRVTSVIEAPEGFIATGESCLTENPYSPNPTCRATIWRSPDGTDWSRAFVDPAGDPGSSPNRTWFHDVAVNDLGYVAVGSTYHVRVSYPVFATSGDGVEWERRQPLESIVHDTSVQFSVVAADDAFLVAGQSCEMGGDCRGVIWRSEDGIAWQTVLEEVPDSAFASVEPVADGHLAVGGTGVVYNYVPVRGDGVVRMWSSFDGITWTDVSSDPAVFGSDRADPEAREFARAVAETGSGIVVAGSPHGDPEAAFLGVDEDPGPVTIWFSEDGTTWARIPTGDVFADATIIDMAAAGDVLVAVGAVGVDPEVAKAWLSDDGGLTWNTMHIDPALTGDESRFLHVTISGDLAIAGLSVDDRAAIWTLDLGDRNDTEGR